MIFVMIVSLYTSRVVLKALGVEDYGIYNVVGGVVAMFTMLSGSLSSAISRFITFELGRGDEEKLSKVFSSSISIQIAIAAILVLLGETIGVLFLNTYMVIPPERMYAANWVLQFSIATFVINLLSVPYNAAIIAHENMNIYAYVSIFECIAKLLIAYLVTVTPFDKLIVYSALLFALSLITRFIYGYHCQKNYTECKFRFIWDSNLLKSMFSFAGWNFIGASSHVLRTQGCNILINLFHGAAVNAACGIATQLNAAVHSFVGNFMTALNPQITKSYANNQSQRLFTLLFQGARLSYFLLLILSLPIIVNANYVIELWLNVVPAHTTLFVRLILILALSESISTPLITAILATGKIRNYQIIVGGIQLMNVPISYILIKLGYIPESVTIVAIILSQCCLIARLILLRKMINLDAKEFIHRVYFNIFLVSICAIIVPIILKISLEENLTTFLFNSLICVINTAFIIFYVGCKSKERVMIANKFRAIKSKIIKND